jgi:hypothetical protein
MTFKLEQSEAEFQVAVQELATAYGWRWIHIQPGASSNGYWRTPVTGQLGKGFPDLLLVKGDRMVAAELKAQRGKLEPSQEFVLGVLGEVGFVEVYVWRPDDWDEITEVLARADSP